MLVGEHPGQGHASGSGIDVVHRSTDGVSVVHRHGAGVNLGHQRCPGCSRLGIWHIRAIGEPVLGDSKVDHHAIDHSIRNRVIARQDLGHVAGIDIDKLAELHLGLTCKIYEVAQTFGYGSRRPGLDQFVGIFQFSASHIMEV